MNIALWVAQGVLAGIFLLAGYTKVTREHGELAERMEWVEDFTGPFIKFVGWAEVLGAIGLILPAATGIAPLLTPTAAAALAVEQVGAAIVHGRRKEAQMIPVNLVLIAGAVFIAWGRFGNYGL